MSLVLVEGWDSLAAVGDRYTITAGTPTLDATIKRNGSQSLKLNNYGVIIALPVPSNQDTYIFGAALYVHPLAGLNPSGQEVTFWAGGTANCSISIGGGQIAAYRGFNLLATSPVVYTGDTWFYLEIKATCKNSISAGDFVVKVNGQTVLTLDAGTDTQNSAVQGIDSIRIAGGYAAYYIYYDDLYICDLLGGINDDFLGDVKVETLYPNGNGTTNQFTGSDADSTDNYLHIDEAQQNGDTDYVEDNTISNLDLYNFDNMAVTPASIKGISVRTYAKKSDAGIRTGKLQCRRSAANYEGSEFFPSTSYQGYDYIWEQDPSTSSAWSKTGVDAAEFGIKVHS